MDTTDLVEIRLAIIIEKCNDLTGKSRFDKTLTLLQFLIDQYDNLKKEIILICQNRIDDWEDDMNILFEREIIQYSDKKEFLNLCTLFKFRN